MKGFGIFKYLIFFIFLVLIFSKPVFATDNTDTATNTNTNSNLTDINEIFGMFEFQKTDDNDLLDKSMTFSASDGKISGEDQFWNKIFSEYAGVVVGVSGVCCLTFALLFLFNFTKLGTTAGNPQARKAVQVNLLWTGLCAGASAVVAIIVSFTHNLIR